MKHNRYTWLWKPKEAESESCGFFIDFLLYVSILESVGVANGERG